MGKQKKNCNWNNKTRDLPFYIVEEIVGKKVCDTGAFIYKVRWEGYSESDDTWEPLENLQNVLHLVQKFDLKEKAKQMKSLTNVNEWLNQFFLPAPEKMEQKGQQMPQPVSFVKMEINRGMISENQNIKNGQSNLPKAQGEFYQVEKIVGRKMISKKLHYRVRWRGYSSKEDTWEPISNLKKAQNLVKKFNLSLKKGLKAMKKREKHYEVEKIMGKRFLGSVQEYKIRWKGFSQKDDTWEPLSNLKGIKKMVDSFNKGLTQSDNGSKIQVANVQKTLPKEEPVSLFRQTDNYEIGGLNSESFQQVMESDEEQVEMSLAQRQSNQFIPMDLQQKQLMEPDFM